MRKIRADDALDNAKHLIDHATQMQWHGAGAEALGLHGPPRRPELLRVWSGRGPWNGEIAVPRGPGGQHVAAFDVVIPAPDALRALWASETPALRDVIEGVHARSVVATIDHVEQALPMVRRRDGDAVVREPAAGLVMARFRGVAAQTEMCGEALPGSGSQLHDHVVVANMALRSHESGVWCGVDGWELFRASTELSAVYHAEAVARLRDLGYRVQHQGGRLDVTGLAMTLSDDRGRQGGAHVAVAARRVHIPTVAADIAQSLAGVDGPTSLTRSSAAVSTGTLRRRVAVASVGAADGTDVAPVIQHVGRSPLLTHVDTNRWTTQHMLRQEWGVVAAARGLAARPPTDVPDVHVAAALDSSRVVLSPEQRSAVDELVRARLGFLAAPAGAGKTEVLRAVADARRRAGHRVFAVATAGETAQRLGTALAADSAFTLEQFFQRVRGSLRLTPTDMVIIDEAGLLETRRWWALLGSAVPASVIAAGDGAQLSPIEAGGMWEVLAREVGVVTLSENFRARDAWARDAWDALRNGHGLDALREYDRRGLVVIEDTRVGALRAAVDRWDADRAQHGDAAALRDSLLLTDRSNGDVDELNRLAQNRRLRTRDISTDGLLVEANPRGYSRSETLHNGDAVVLTRHVRRAGPTGRLESGTTGQVTAHDTNVPALDVRMADRIERIEGDDTAAVRLGYARHVYAAQSRTVDRVYAVVGGWQTHRESSYVAISRARDAAVVVTDYPSLGVTPGDRDAALQELGRRVSTSLAKRAAVDRADTTDVVPLRPRTPTSRLRADRPDSAGDGRSSRDDERARSESVRLAARRTERDTERGGAECSR